jgi:hypothetical protein
MDIMVNIKTVYENSEQILDSVVWKSANFNISLSSVKLSVAPGLRVSEQFYVLKKK